jgi:hypothetical protein
MVAAAAALRMVNLPGRVAPLPSVRRCGISCLAKKSRVSPPTRPKGSKAPPWLRVQLCPMLTPKKATMEPSARLLLQTIELNGSWNSLSSFSHSSFILSPVNHTLNHIAPPSSTLPPLFCVGDIIDLDALPKRGFPAAEGKAAIFPLKQSARGSLRGGGRSKGLLSLAGLPWSQPAPSCCLPADLARRASLGGAIAARYMP